MSLAGHVRPMAITSWPRCTWEEDGFVSKWAGPEDSSRALLRPRAMSATSKWMDGGPCILVRANGWSAKATNAVLCNVDVPGDMKPSSSVQEYRVVRCGQKHQSRLAFAWLVGLESPDMAFFLTGLRLGHFNSRIETTGWLGAWLATRAAVRASPTK